MRETSKHMIERGIAYAQKTRPALQVELWCAACSTAHNAFKNT